MSSWRKIQCNLFKIPQNGPIEKRASDSKQSKMKWKIICDGTK